MGDEAGTGDAAAAAAGEAALATGDAGLACVGVAGDEGAQPVKAMTSDVMANLASETPRPLPRIKPPCMTVLCNSSEAVGRNGRRQRTETIIDAGSQMVNGHKTWGAPQVVTNFRARAIARSDTRTGRCRPRRPGPKAASRAP
jgi:hypothetical protein